MFQRLAKVSESTWLVFCYLMFPYLVSELEISETFAVTLDKIIVSKLLSEVNSAALVQVLTVTWSIIINVPLAEESLRSNFSAGVSHSIILILVVS